MNYLPIALLSQLLNSLALTVDKFLLTKTIRDPLTYIFYFSLVSSLAILALPFVNIPSPPVVILASVATLTWTAGAYAMFKALQKGALDRVIPSIGALIPVILVAFAIAKQTISLNEMWASGLLILGLILLTIHSFRGKTKKIEIVLIIISAIFFAFSYLLLRQAFLQQDFLTVLVWSRPILIPLGVIIFAIPTLRKKVFTFRKSNFNLKSGALVLFAFGQASAATSEVLLLFATSLADPALVNSVQGTKFVFLLILSYLLGKKFPAVFREKSSRWVLATKFFAICLIGVGLYILAFSQIPKEEAKLGVTFSPRYAHELGLNPKITYVKMLDELRVSIVRLPIYWDEVEQFPQKLNFQALDFYLDEAQKAGVEVILVIGLKQPRWPECFAPPWAKNGMRQDRSSRILNLIKREVAHFKKYPNITFWQVENEPLVPFGVCEQITPSTLNLLQKEIEVVRKFDQRPILLTDSGELSTWRKIIPHADLLGISLYRSVWNPVFGLLDYPLPPIFYSLKANLLLVLTGKTVPIIISELQAEPWIPGGRSISQTSISEQVKLFPVKKLQSNVSYAHETGFSEIHLWGVEWWYFMAQHGHPQYLDYAKTLFRE